MRPTSIRLTLIRAALAAITLSLLPAAAHADTNADINAIYTRLADGIRSADPAVSHATYAPDAIFLPSQPVGIDRGAVVHERLKQGGERLKADGAGMTIAFRLVSRQLVGDALAIDTGYYRTDMTRPAGEPRTMTRYNKMLVVSAKQPDGRWLITHDASIAASQAAFDAAAPQPGLKFDK